MMERNILDSEIKIFLNNIANNVGDTINEYHWREASALMVQIDEANPNVKIDTPVLDNSSCDCDFPRFTFDSPMECENCGGGYDR
jgi:hypothetical protein